MADRSWRVRHVSFSSLRGPRTHVAPSSSWDALSVELDSDYSWAGVVASIFRLIFHSFFANDSLLYCCDTPISF